MSCVFFFVLADVKPWDLGRIGHAAVIATVDGKNPAPPEFHKNLSNSGINHLSTDAEHLPPTVSA